MNTVSKTEIEEGGDKTEPSSSAHNFPIVGIGASAGGLDAFKELLKAIPEDSGMAYVLVQHLNPAHESNLTEILSRVTKIPIEKITDDVNILPNHIYVMPSGKILTSVDGVLKLTPRQSVKTNLVIDIFFTSLAVVWESMAVGVVLSGTGTDGTLGLKMIKEHGGITLVQDDSAAYGDMPQSAVNAGVVDFVLPAEKIPDQLLQIRNTYDIAHVNGEEEPLPHNDEVVFKQMLQLLLQRSGVDFTYYKQSTVRRRIGRRMALHKREKLADYLKFLRINKAEQDALFQDMLITVTSFFRDPKTFETLTEKVFPALLKNKPGEDAIRFWIAGCSTGEEAYSIAICLHEFLGKKLNPPSGGRGAIQIFASDISETAIKKARAGIYSKAEVQTISEERLNNYFTKTGGSYQVNKVIRDICVFASHNFLKDPPFVKMDLITCRNVFIYMDNFLQKKALTTFHYALKENGILLLGKSETVSAASELFTYFDKHRKIYLRKPGTGRYMQVTGVGSEEIVTTQNIEAKKEILQTDFRNSADAILISKSPAAVVVNEEMDIVHIHGDTSPFLKPSPGKPSFNLLKMAKEGLAFELRSILHKAKTSKAPIIKEEIPVNADSKQSLVSIEIIPLVDTVEPHYLILFTKIYLPATPSLLERAGMRSIKNAEALKRNEQLEKELAHTREDMLSITEEMEAANEELQSANEELQSSNEEMQSLNEELETSKEELQSTNEELLIVNHELLDKQEQLNASYLEQVEARKRIEAIEKEQSKLARQLKLSTDSAKVGIWSLDIVSSKLEWSNIHKKMWGYDEHREDLTYEDWHKVIVPEDKELAFQRIEESKVNHGIYDVDYRITRANDGAIVWIKSTGQYYYDEFGVAHTLTGISIDITEQKAAGQKLITTAIELATKNKLIETNEAKFRNLIVQAPVLITTFEGPSYKVGEINKRALEIWEKTYEQVINKPLFEVSPELEEGLKTTLKDIYTTGEPFINNEIAVQIKRPGKPDTAYFNLLYQPLRDLDNKIYAIMLIGTEVTDAVNARKLIEASEAFNRTVLESSPDCLKVLDSEGRIQYMNFNGLCQMEIDDFSAVENKNWWTMWGSGNEALVKASVDKALKGETAHFTALCPTAKGTPKWWDVVVSPVGKAGEPVQQIISVSRDITEQKKSEEALEKMASHLKLATDSANVGTWLLNIPTQILEWSALHKRMWGYDEHRKRLEYEDWHKLILPEDKEKTFKKIEEARVNHTVYEAQYYINRANDGALRYMRSVGKYYYDDKGEAEKLTGISIDITEQKQAEEKIKESEERFRTFANSIQNLAWIANGEGWTYWYNQRWYDYTGTKLEEMEGWGWEKVLHPDHIKKVMEFIKEAWKKDEAFELTFPLRRHDGEYQWFLTRVYPLKDARGNIERWIGTNTDIHEQKTREQQKDEFIDIASHEMKTPLTTAKGYIQLLLRSLSEENQTALYANKANQAVERLHNLITDLLDSSKIQNGQLNYTITTFDFNNMVDEIIENFQHSAKNHSIQKTGNTLQQITGDRSRLQQVVINLLSNAVKYSPNADKVFIKIEEQQKKIQLSVQDFGIGMSKQHLDKIFDRYYRVQENSINFQGLGIGLYISNNIVERHEGIMWVQSEPEKGSTFYFTLPL